MRYIYLNKNFKKERVGWNRFCFTGSSYLRHFVNHCWQEQEVTGLVVAAAAIITKKIAVV